MVNIYGIHKGMIIQVAMIVSPATWGTGWIARGLISPGMVPMSLCFNSLLADLRLINKDTTITNNDSIFKSRIVWLSTWAADDWTLHCAHCILHSQLIWSAGFRKWFVLHCWATQYDTISFVRAKRERQQHRWYCFLLGTIVFITQTYSDLFTCNHM